MRCVLASLALKYRWVLEKMEQILGKRLPVIHIVGGGTQNTLLCQLTADATGRTVLAGPVEATAISNILVQAMALGYINGLSEAREIIKKSFEVKIYQPSPGEPWDDAYEKFLKLLS